MSNLALIFSRYSALVFAIGLGIGETVINWGNWQFAPLWIVDYMIVAWLFLGSIKTRLGGNVEILLSGWAFAFGVFYMALFVSLDPELAPYIGANSMLLILMGLMLGLSVIGFLCALFAIYAKQS